MISIETTLEADFSYDHQTGEIYRKGKRVGASCDGGRYMRVWVAGKHIRHHRVAWYLYYGSWPAFNIDHINGDGCDNRILNLREVTHSENLRNKKSYSRTESLPHGVTSRITKRLGVRYRSQIGVRGRVVHSKTYGSIEEAVAERERMLIANNYHENHCRR